jgi:Arc/MetJ-type ribon-helix-helix transcriptional regulator
LFDRTSLRRYDTLSYRKCQMPKTKLAVTLDSALVQNLDHLVAKHEFANRSQAIEAAVAEKLARMARTRLARECAKLDPDEEGLGGSAETWPEY